LLKTDDKKAFGNFQTFKELNYLENVEITIQIENTDHQIFFSLGLILGDNLGIHSILLFTKSFVSNFPCRFCKLPKELCRVTTLSVQTLCEVCKIMQMMLTPIIYPNKR